MLKIMDYLHGSETKGFDEYAIKRFLKNIEEHGMFIVITETEYNVTSSAEFPQKRETLKKVTFV